MITRSSETNINPRRYTGKQCIVMYSFLYNYRRKKCVKTFHGLKKLNLHGEM